MRRRILIATAGLIAVAAASPALASPVGVSNDGGCYNATIGNKNVLPNPLCYLGPPPPPPLD